MLAAGARLGVYEITGRLGAGAMGEVYRARDPRLGRDIAIKILPEGMAESVERRRRFEQESRAAGALNHPNIVAVYDTGEEGGVSFIVSELVEGESLRELIRHGVLTVRRAVDIAAQIADGLAAAHAAGIVHRDLKPENVMLHRDGRPKVLDFGLARYQPAAAAQAQAVEGTMTMTNPGMIMGTPGYMSPEQVAGAPTDARADIFALGIMLHEMLSGKPAFERATSVETMSAILREDPPELPAAVPPGLRNIVLHCLEKEPSRRYQSVQDLGFALRALSGSSIAAAPTLPTLKTQCHFLRIAAVVFVAVAAYGVTGLLLAPRGTNLGSYHFTPLASDATRQGNPVWSPDGKSFAYIRFEPGGSNSLMIRNLDSMLPVTAVKADLNGTPLWSPDGDRVFYRTPEGYFSVSRAGGGRQQVLKGQFAAAALSPDGRSLVVWTNNAPDGKPKLWISSPPGAELRKYQPANWEHPSGNPMFLRFSPNGRQLAASIYGTAGAEVWLLPFPDGAAARGKPHRIFLSGLPVDAPPISWMPDNRHVMLSFPTPYSMSRLWMGDTETGSLTPITLGESNMGMPSVSPDGTKIVYNSGISDSDIVQLPLEGGMARPLLATASNESAAAWSPKGPQFAFVTSRNGRPEIWAQSTQEGWERPVVTRRDFPDDTVGLFAPAFSPDGERLAYVRASNKRLAVIWISPAAGGEPIRLSDEADYGMGPTWSPDGNSIAYSSFQHGLVRTVVGSGQPPVTIRDKGCIRAAQWSPDGQWIACPDPGHVALISPDGKMSRVVGERPAMVAWSHDSKTLYTLAEDVSQKWLLTSIDVKTETEKTIATMGAEERFLAGFTDNSMISLSPDGKSIAATSTTSKNDIWMLEGFPQPRGWLARLLWWR